MWIVAAVFSAFFAGITAILSKCGIKKRQFRRRYGDTHVGRTRFCLGNRFRNGSVRNAFGNRSALADFSRPVGNRHRSELDLLF